MRFPARRSRSISDMDEDVRRSTTPRDQRRRHGARSGSRARCTSNQHRLRDRSRRPTAPTDTSGDEAGRDVGSADDDRTTPRTAERHHQHDGRLLLQRRHGHHRLRRRHGARRMGDQRDLRRRRGRGRADRAGRGRLGVVLRDGGSRQDLQDHGRGQPGEHAGRRRERTAPAMVSRTSHTGLSVCRPRWTPA